MHEIFHDYVIHPLVHALEHSLYMLPVLLIVYLVIELLEHKAMDKLRRAFASKRLGIVGAAALGLFPQCGFSVAAANLYSERLITAGTLAAVFIATSDEALPIIAADQSSAAWFLPLLLIKFGWAIIAGVLVSFVFHFTGLERAPHTVSHHSEHVHEGGEHHHCEHCDSSRGIITSAIKRTLSIFLFIVLTGFALNLAIELLGEERLSALLMNDTLLQPFLASLIGLIPNCAASIVLSRLFISGALGFGSLAAGLCAGAGLGILVLFRVNRSMKQNCAMLGLVWGLSALLGVVIEIVL